CPQADHRPGAEEEGPTGTALLPPAGTAALDRTRVPSRPVGLAGAGRRPCPDGAEACPQAAPHRPVLGRFLEAALLYPPGPLTGERTGPTRPMGKLSSDGRALAEGVHQGPGETETIARVGQPDVEEGLRYHQEMRSTMAKWSPARPEKLIYYK